MSLDTGGQLTALPKNPAAGFEGSLRSGKKRGGKERKVGEKETRSSSRDETANVNFFTTTSYTHYKITTFTVQ